MVTTEIRLESFRSVAQDVTLGSAMSEGLELDARQPGTLLDSIVDTFMPNASGGDPAMDAKANPADGLSGMFKQSAWKPQTQLDNSRVATNVKQSNNTAQAMGAEAKEGLANIAAVEQDMKQGAPDQNPDANGMSLAGVGRGLAFETAAVGAVGLAAGPMAAAALGGAMLAKDIFSAVAGGGGMDARVTQGPSPQTVTLKGQEARDAARGHLPAEMRMAQSGPNNSFEAAARDAESGYSRRNMAELSARSQITADSLSGIDQIKIEGSEEADMMHNHIEEAKAGFEHQLHISEELKQGLDAREHNGVEVASAAEMGGVNAENAQLSASMKTAFVPGQFA